MKNLSTSSNAIEVLEPLLLMSASAMDAEPIEIACGGEDFGGERDTDGRFTARFNGNRADYSATDQGFGIFAIRCGNDSSAEFVTDVSEITFLDGTFSIDDLTADTGAEILGEESVAAEDFADELAEPDTVVPDAITMFLTDFDDDGNDDIVTSRAEELTEEAWFSVTNTEANDVVDNRFESEFAEVIVVEEAPIVPAEVVLDESVEGELTAVNAAEEISAVSVPVTLDDMAIVPVLLANEAVTDTAEMSDCEGMNEPINNGPDGQNDAVITNQDTTVFDTVAGNDSDPDGDTLTFYVEEGPQNGSIDFATDGTYTYTPDPGFSGQDTFTYEVNDGNGGTDIAEVCVTIVATDECAVIEAAGNNGPDGQNDAVITNQDTAVFDTVAGNDSDLDGDTLTFYVEEGPQNGSIDFATDGTYTYTPDPGFSGQDTFTYEVNDGNGGTDIAEVCVTIVATDECAVIEAADDEYSTDQDQSIEGNVLSNDTDGDGDQLTASPMTDVLTSSGGLVSLHEDGSFVYDPADGFSGVDTFRYSATDGNGSTASATVTITINDVPLTPQDDVFTGDNASEIEGDVTANDGGDTTETEITIIDAPTNGTLTINPDGTFRYLANDGFSGEDSFTYSLSHCGVVAGSSTVRMVVAEVNYDTTYVSAGNNGRVWGDPHFEGDDGGLYDVQGEADHIYNILSDSDLQVNSLFIPWEGHEGSTMMGQIGATVGTDLVLADETGTFINGVAVQAGEVITLADGQIEYDGEYTTVTTAEYKLEFHRRDGWYDMKLEAINPFSDNVAPHGLWGLTVDGDTEARNGDFFKTHGWDYTLQGGGALDTVSEDGNVVVSETGDRSAYKLYEAANLFSTDALNSEGDRFFRFSTRQGTGLTPIA